MYVYIDLGGKDLCLLRIGGPGLGNLLFPWARGIVAARKYNAIPIWPTWPQLKIGTYIRGERDKRNYTNTFLANDNYCQGMKKIKCVMSLSKFGLSEDLISDGLYGKDDVFIFSGMDNLFQPIINDHQLVRSELEKIVNPKHFLYRAFDFSNTISVHVRLGDFSEYNKNVSGVSTNMKMPLEWYIDVINQLRRNQSIRVLLFSDGSDDELEPLLKMSNIERVSFGSAIADLLALSYSNIMISSNSTFSMWASYLGRMPVIRPNSLQLYSENECDEVVVNVGGCLPEGFINQLLADQRIF